MRIKQRPQGWWLQTPAQLHKFILAGVLAAQPQRDLVICRGWQLEHPQKIVCCRAVAKLVPEDRHVATGTLKMTLKERIVDHRNKPACISCHAKIDPWGIAFENYDALGVYRTKIKNKPVDATSALFNKQELAGMEGLKRYLLEERQDQFARAMVHKMTSYALGRPLTFSDHAEIEALTIQLRKKEDRLRDLIYLIIYSSIFNSN